MCKVTVCDVEGIGHTVELSAASLYEAVALGFRAIGKAIGPRRFPKGRAMSRCPWLTSESTTLCVENV